jgi:pilus assembly protein CpaC
MRSVMVGGALCSLLFLAVPTMVMWPTEAHAQAPDQEFTIAVGETLTFNARGVTRLAIGMPEVANTQTSSDGRLLLVTGTAVGVTTLNIFSGDGQKTLLIRVVGVNPMSLAEEVREVLGDRSGVDVRVVKGRVLLEGEVASENFKRKIDRMTELYPNQVLNFATYREAFVEGARMVAMDLYFIQMATSNRDSLGVQWNQFLGANFTFGSGDIPLYYSGDQLGSGVLPGGGETAGLPRAAAMTAGDGLTGYWSLVGNLNVALDFLVEQGLIKTVQNGTLITEAGTEAEYHSGGTLLIPIEGGLGGGEMYEKPYGFRVKVTPVLDFENRVKLMVKLEYSELDYANGVGGVPALRNNDVVSVVNMREGQSVLISSQNNLTATSGERGWWMLSRIPILGWVFKSRDYLGQTMNNALFVTPKVYEPGGEYHRTLIQGVFTNLLEAGARPNDLPELSNARN